MKSTRPRRRGPRRARSIWGRIAGYGGAALLVAAAVVVLLVPLLDQDEDSAGAGTASAGASPTAGQGAVPGASGQPGSPTDPVPQNSGGRPYTGGAQDGGQSGSQGGGMPIPDQNGGGIGWCPKGTAAYRAAGGNVDVVIAVSSSGLVRVELSVKGHAMQQRQSSVSGGKPHTFRFRNVPARLVERVKVTTVSVGVAMQNCYARPA